MPKSPPILICEIPGKKILLLKSPNYESDSIASGDLIGIIRLILLAIGSLEVILSQVLRHPLIPI